MWTATTPTRRPAHYLAIPPSLFGTVIHAVLSKKRSPTPASPPAPAANLSGRWDVNIEFFSSKSQHTLYLTQDGNRVQGSHKGDFSTRDIFGTIEADNLTKTTCHTSGFFSTAALVRPE